MAKRSEFAQSLRSPFQWIVVGGMVVLFLYVALAPINQGIRGHQNPELGSTHAIMLAMYSYAIDYKGAYPTGKSSTEVFQKLVDGGYITDPKIFYVKRFGVPGKTPATSNALKPENVCFDVTVPLDDKSSDSLPVLFSTGYRIHYIPGGSAVPLSPRSGNEPAGLWVGYLNMSTSYRQSDGQSDGAVKNFISPDYAPTGKTYQQLTPDGPLAP